MNTIISGIKALVFSIRTRLQLKTISGNSKIPMRAWISSLILLLFFGCSHAEQLDLSRLKVPDGFHVSVFAEAPAARLLAFSPGGVLLVTEMSDGKVVAFPDAKQSGKGERMAKVLHDLNAPKGTDCTHDKLV